MASTPPKKVLFRPQVRVRSEPNLGPKTKTMLPHKSDALSLTKKFKPVFVSLRTRYLGLSRQITNGKGQKSWHHRKRASNFSVMSTGPSFYRETEEGRLAEDTSLYTENSQNKVEQKAELLSKTKFRTLNALASYLKNRKSLPTEAVKQPRKHSKDHTYDQTTEMQPQIHADSYDTVVRFLKEAASHSSGQKKRQIKILVDLPKLPFGKHVAYNSVAEFRKTHVVDFEPSAQLMDKVTNEIWIKKLERRRKTESEVARPQTKAEADLDFQSEELQLYNSKLKVAEENLYLHYSTGSKFWKRDLMEKQAGWRGLYRLELKRNSALNVTT